MRHFPLNSRSFSVLVLAASAASFAVGCSSDSPRDFERAQGGASGAGTAGAGQAGAGKAGAGTAGALTSPGGASSAGAASGGAPSAGAGGTSAGGAGPVAGAGGVTTGSAGAATGGGTASPCPADATFCSGFETNTLPMNAVYKVNAAPGEWTRDFEVDSSLAHSGKSSLRMKMTSESGASGSSYRMLAVPAPSGAFWVRFYIQQADRDLGGNDHNEFAAAAVSDDPNAAAIEFAEDVGIAFNTSDAVRWPMGYGRTMSGGTMPFTLPKAMWHCIEISFDGQGRQQQLFINGTQQIDAKDYPGSAIAIKTFKFGFMQYHGPDRKIWYDDVAVAPTRIKCL